MLAHSFWQCHSSPDTPFLFTIKDLNDNVIAYSSSPQQAALISQAPLLLDIANSIIAFENHQPPLLWDTLAFAAHHASDEIARISHELSKEDE